MSKQSMDHAQAKDWLCDFIMLCRGAFASNADKDRFNHKSEYIMSMLTNGEADWEGPTPTEKIKTENEKLRIENEQLKRWVKFKIEYPAPTIFWMDGVHAYANNTYVGRIQVCSPGNTWAITCPPTCEKEWLGEFSTREKAQDEFIARWQNFWNLIHSKNEIREVLK